MTNREKEIRTKIGSECLYNGWRSDYLTSCSEEYDFIRCPDSFECCKDYIKDFYAGCDTTRQNQIFPCKQCWKNFLNGEINE